MVATKASYLTLTLAGFPLDIRACLFADFSEGRVHYLLAVSPSDVPLASLVLIGADLPGRASSGSFQLFAGAVVRENQVAAFSLYY